MKFYDARSAAIRRNLFGRRVLYATPPDNLDARSIALILGDVLPLHQKNAEEINYLYWYFRGKQPILERTKEIRPEITNIVLENRAHEIVEFKKGYEFSHPVQITNASQRDTGAIERLNAYARADGKERKDLSLAEWFYISGNAYRICMPSPSYSIDEAPYYTDVIDPREAFVVYSNQIGHEPLFAGTISEQKNLDTGKTEWACDVFTATQRFSWTVGRKRARLVDIKPEITDNGVDRIPIVEYILNESRIGYVELCIHLFDAINNIGSNRMDAIEQLVQAYLVLINCQLPENDDGQPTIPKSGDAIMVSSQQGGGNADVKFVSVNLDQSQTQIAKDDYIQSAYEVCGVPDRQSRNQGGGDTGQAVVLRNGWGAAEARAASTEKLFKGSENEYLKCVLSICRRRVPEDIGDLTLMDIETKLTRNRSDNMQVKAQTLDMLLKCGVDPENAYEYCEMFSDPAAVWLKSQAYQAKMAEAMIAVLKRLDNEGADASLKDSIIALLPAPIAALVKYRHQSADAASSKDDKNLNVGKTNVAVSGTEQNPQEVMA